MVNKNEKRYVNEKTMESWQKENRKMKKRQHSMFAQKLTLLKFYQKKQGFAILQLNK